MATTQERDDFEELFRLLQKHGLDWIAAEVAADIALGKTRRQLYRAPVRREIDYFDVVELSQSVPGSRRQSEFLTSEPFSERERLERLVEAIRHAVVESPAMEDTVIRVSGRGLILADPAEGPAGEEHLTGTGDRLAMARELLRSLESVVPRGQEDEA